MGNFAFLSEGIPIQTSSALYDILDSGVAGKFYSLGEDVNAIFFEPASGLEDSPSEACASYLDHLSMTGRKLHPVYNVALEEFCTLLEQRKGSMSGRF